MEQNKDYNIAVGSRIRETREKMRLSREAFSEKCDISSSFLSAIENGKKSLTAKTLYKICNMSGVTADYLILGKESSKQEAVMTEKLLEPLDTQSRTFAVQILSDYVEAINAAKSSK